MNLRNRIASGIVFGLAAVLFTPTFAFAQKPIDFNREIRPILSNNCFACHGPDGSKRKGVTKPLRLDTEEGAFADLGGYAAIVRGKPDDSDLITRIVSDDANEVMPPPKHAKKLSQHEVALLTNWIKQGAPFAKHWSYVKPVRPEVPATKDTTWSKNAIDRFILARLEKEGLKPSPEADRYTLIRRLSLDLTGLPPTVAEADAFTNDKSPNAYEKLVDRLLSTPAYAEHWGRLWLDLARYADSAGYADDPPRTIWAYRDYVIRSFEKNKPFDIFTIEQFAGDLLPSPTEEELVATAFHRNTLTNNEGGTNDEEFRNVAVVDRTNTTMAVWMGTTMACAQCHTHKYDPISQTEYFRLFAILNNTQDADTRDETPTLPIFSAEQKRQKAAWADEIVSLEKALKNPAPETLAAQADWEKQYAAGATWNTIEPRSLEFKSGVKLKTQPDHAIVVDNRPADTFTLTLPPTNGALQAIRVETLPGATEFAINDIKLEAIPPGGARKSGRFVRIEIPGKSKILSLAEVQVFQGDTNVALKGAAKQSSTDYEGPAKLAIDGNTDGRYVEAKSTTHTTISDDPWWEVDLKSVQGVDRVVIWNRLDGVEARLADFKVTLLDDKKKPVWSQVVSKPPTPSVALSTGGPRPIDFKLAQADLTPVDLAKGWRVTSDAAKQPHSLVLVPKAPADLETGATLALTIDQKGLGSFRVSTTADVRAAEFASLPQPIVAILKTSISARSKSQTDELSKYYIDNLSPVIKQQKARVASLGMQITAMKPDTTVPIYREMDSKARRVTKLQRRGNFMDLGDEVKEGVPVAFGNLPANAPANRLTLARWLVSPENPLTGRVIANRYWEQMFGIGLVASSEEFGAQGDLPSHPELLDWLAVEVIDSHWDMKHLLRLLVNSAAYRQSSKVSPELVQRDPDNRLLARGPRVRLSAEMVRDQALAVSGLLSTKMYGPPVKPPQPSLGLSAAFGSAVDWETSKGEDRFRRGLYTTWRRSSPYPSMATFDAPNREICTLKRTRTNTPLQALVTLNDPVYVEAAQALGRKMSGTAGSTADKVRTGLKLALTRNATDAEVARLVTLHDKSKTVFAADAAHAKQLATEPIGPAPKDADLADLASWTVVGNVLLNLDEMLLKR